MRFVSTRAGAAGGGVGFCDAVLAGYAADGGMLLPERVPELDAAALRAWAALSYPALVEELLAIYACGEGGVSRGELHEAVDASLVRGDFPPGAVRMREVNAPSLPGDGATPRVPGKVSVVELFHGPTAAFKDLGLQVLGRLMDAILRARRKRLTVLVGTSGDTGSAAMEAVAGLSSIDLAVLYPLGRVSTVQEAQMLSASGREDARNVTLVAVEGTSDELDMPIKRLFDDAAFRQEFDLGSLNSVNIVRLLVQAAHCFWAYLQLCPAADQEATFYLPTGAGGHMVAAVVARLMGLPVRVHACVNANQCLVRLARDGELAPGAETIPTVAPAMDIASPYNLERLLWYASGGDGAAVAHWAAAQERAERVRLPSAVVGSLKGVLGVDASSVSDADALGAMKAVAEQPGAYLVCPHTAVGLAVVARHRPRGDAAGGPRLVAATASPSKFVEALSQALKIKPEEAAERLREYGSPNERAAASLHSAVRGETLPTKTGAVKRTLRNPSVCFCRGDNWDAMLRGVVKGLAGRTLERESAGVGNVEGTKGTNARVALISGAALAAALALVATKKTSSQGTRAQPF